MALKLKYWRKFRSLSIDELAAKANVSPQTIVNIEAHGIEPRPKTVRKLAEALEVTPDKLLVFEEVENEPLTKLPKFLAVALS